MRTQSAIPRNYDDFPVSEAVLSDDLVYRYTLDRRWAWDGPVMVWIGLNPSTADHQADDPTIRRMCGFARREGCRGICVLNLYALRATDPRELARHPDPVGPENDDWLAGVGIAADGPVVAAWGAHPFAARREQAVTQLLALAGVTQLMCLGMTGQGYPNHPLYLRADAPLVPWEPAEADRWP